MTKVLFLGTDEFAVPILKQLQEESSLEIVGVVTQPDKPVGRKQLMTASPVKQILDGTVTQTFQPDKLRTEAEAILEQTKPDLIVCVAYRQIVPKIMLDYPKLGAINIHGSLLPKLRGAVPIPMAILQGFIKTGVTIQFMAEALDAGDIVSSAEVEISNTDTTESLKLRLAALGAQLLHETLPALLSGAAPRTPQNEAEATFCYERDIAKENAEISFSTPVKQAERMIRAFYPWPVAWAKISHQGAEKRLKIFAAQISDSAPDPSALKISRDGKRLLLQLQNGVLELTDLQLEGKKRGGAEDYLFLA